MSKFVMMDELHVQLLVPRDLTAVQYRPIRRALHDPRLQQALGRAVRAVIRRHPALKEIRIAFDRYGRGGRKPAATTVSS